MFDTKNTIKRKIYKGQMAHSLKRSYNLSSFGFFNALLCGVKVEHNFHEGNLVFFLFRIPSVHLLLQIFYPFILLENPTPHEIQLRCDVRFSSGQMLHFLQIFLTGSGIGALHERDPPLQLCDFIFQFVDLLGLIVRGVALMFQLT